MTKKLIQKTITMPCRTEFLHEGRTLVKATLAEAGLPEREKDLLVLAVDEAVSSLVQYAQHKGYAHEVSLTVDIDDVRFKATLVDSLNVFELDGDLTPAQMEESLAGDRPFTLGIFLIRRIMDEISYVYRKGFQNELELIKFL